MTEDARARFAARLRELKDAAGLSVRGLMVASARTPRRQPDQEPIRLKRSTIDGMTSRSRPVRPERHNFEVFVDTCLRVAAQSGRALPAGLGDRRAWDEEYRALRDETEVPRSWPRPAGTPPVAVPVLVPIPVPAPGAEDAPPYRGLESYGSADARFFFGRDDLVETLMDRAGDGGLLVVTGASGAGKSSLLRAGLVPALARAGSRGTVLLEPGDEPIVSLRHLLGTADAEPLAERARRRWKGEVVIVDQFEEVFGASDEQRRDYLATLAALAGDGGAQAVILGVRADFFGQCAACPELVPALEHPVVVVPMDHGSLLEVIEGPAQVAGLTLEDGLADLLLEDLRSDRDHADAVGVLPLLSHALLQTWNHRQDTTLTFAGYRATGGITRSLAQTADAAVDGLGLGGRRAARRLLTRLVQLGTDAPDTARRLLLADVVPAGADGEPTQRVLDHLVRARLLTVDDRSVQITHEALIRGWPRLRLWLEEDRADLLTRQQLAADAFDWERNGRNPAYLYSGTRLSNAVALRGVDGVAAEFLAAGRRAAAQRTRRRRTTTAVLAVSLVISLIAAISAVLLFGDARAQAAVALSRQISAQSRNSVEIDPATALRLAVTAWRIAPTEEARQAMLDTLANPARHVLVGHTYWVYAAAYAPNGRILATAGGDTTVRLWSTSGYEQLGASLIGHTAHVTSVVFSRDGGTLATGSLDGTARLWDVAARTPIGRPIDLRPAQIQSVALSPDGATLATAATDGTVRLWSVSDHRQLAALTRAGQEFYGVAFSPDGKLLAAAASDGTHLFDMTTRHAVAHLRIPAKEWVSAVSFSPDGRLLATAHSDGTARLWNAGTRRRIAELRGHDDDVRAVAFSPGGELLVTGSADRKARLWDVRTGQAVRQPLTGHTDKIFGVAFSPDGRSLATADADQTVRVWDVSARRQLGTAFGDHEAEVNDLAFTPDSATLASAGADRRVGLWDVAEQLPIGPPYRLPWEALSVDISPDGGLLAVGAGERQRAEGGFAPGNGRGEARLWKLATREQVGTPLAADGPVIAALSFSPDGHRLATAGFDNQAHLWDVATRHEVGKPFAGHRTWLKAVAFSPDGKMLATTALDNTIRLWEAATSRQIGPPISGHANWVKAVAFHPDGAIIATVADDRTARLWDVAARRQVGRTMLGHEHPYLDGVAFSPDGKTLATSGEDGTVRLWDVATQLQIGPPLWHPVAVRAVIFSPDGTKLATGDSDGRIRLWDVTPPSDPFRAVCAAAGRSLTADEWRRHLPEGQSYLKVC
ncbi:hypothetical protein ACIBI9_19510 [Nonomuraea sp. NPDC050451]|uniref:nSTAND1 domain-containing NTPase n=1 Tax=Nonomuraea sp. NPDC050451 TaxID=3364364 RepID=UPI00379035E0